MSRLSPGVRLGHYLVESSIGAGGMGEVYQARDTRLDRLVAIKVIPPELANTPELGYPPACCRRSKLP